MQISTRTNYALRAMSELALVEDNRPLPISEICRLQNLPLKYIEQLFRKLKKHDLVKSVHGVKGGYLLTRKLDKISLKDIITAVDDQITQDNCYRYQKSHEHCKITTCGLSKFWDEINSDLEKYFDTINLATIVAMIKEKE
jgi:Rrf2 family iron-sulfur cluster assembly transcriptional regulator